MSRCVDCGNSNCTCEELEQEVQALRERVKDLEDEMFEVRQKLGLDDD